MRKKMLKKYMWLKRTEIYADDTRTCAQPRTHMKEKVREKYSAEPAEIQDNKTIAVENKTKLCLEEKMM